jgi:meiosis-specific protein
MQGFISEQSITINDIGFAETRSRSYKGNKSKGKPGKSRKNVQKAKYRFNRAMLSSVEYSNYFNPDSEVEGRILGLPELVRDPVACLIRLTVRIQKARLKTLRQPPVSAFSGVSTLQPPQKYTESHAQLDTQTQDESQFLAALSLSDVDPKRSHTPPDVDDARRPKKKVKVSVAHAVDLAE